MVQFFNTYRDLYFKICIHIRKVDTIRNHTVLFAPLCVNLAIKMYWVFSLFLLTTVALSYHNRKRQTILIFFDITIRLFYFLFLSIFVQTLATLINLAIYISLAFDLFSPHICNGRCECRRKFLTRLYFMTTKTK